MRIAQYTCIAIALAFAIALSTCSFFTNTVETPTIDIESGTFDTTQKISVTTQTEGATIKYTMDDSDPLTSTTFGIGKVGSATASVTISRSLTLKTYAYMSGMVDSEVASATYVITSSSAVGPDYVVSSPAYPPNVVPSGAFEGNFRISNTSVAGIEDIDWTVYISPDANYDADDTEADSGTQAALAVGDVSGVITFTGTWPGSPTGYYLIIILTATDELVTGDNVTVSSLVPLAASGRFVAVGDNGHVTYSDDGGATWTAADTDLGANNFTGIALDADSGTLVVVGASALGDAVAFYSNDGGVNWTPSGTTIAEPLKEVTWGKDSTLGARFVAVGTNRVIYTTDPSVSWTVSTVTARAYVDTAFGTDIFVAVPNQANVAEYSVDGAGGWTSTTSGLVPNSVILGVTYAATRFVGVGNDTAVERFFYTSDGIVWETVIPAGRIAGTMRAVAYDGSTYVVAVGDNGRIWYSSNEGSTWGIAAGLPIPDSHLRGIVYGDGVWIAVGTAASGNIWRSDIIADTWEYNAESANTLQDIIYIP